MLSFTRDITGQKQIKDELISQRNRLKNILYGSNVGTWEWNLITNENIINEEWANMLGYSINEISPVTIDTWRNLTHPEDLEKAEKLLSLLIKGGIDHFVAEIRMKHKKGKWIWVLTMGKIVAWTKQGKPSMAAGTHIDITARKQAEKEIKHQLLEKEILLKEVHHRIKNNLASIEGLLSIQLDSVTNPDAVSAIQSAITRVNSMRVLYERLLLKEDYEDISVKPYLENLVNDIMDMYYTIPNLKVVKNIDDFRLDAKRLSSLGIIANELLTNSMKYAFKDRNSGKIEINLKKSKGEIQLIIQDDGIGLPDKSGEFQTKGLGTMLVKTITDQLEGEFSTEVKNGTKCTITFPAH